MPATIKPECVPAAINYPCRIAVYAAVVPVARRVVGCPAAGAVVESPEAHQVQHVAYAYRDVVCAHLCASGVVCGCVDGVVAAFEACSVPVVEVAGCIGCNYAA